MGGYQFRRQRPVLNYIADFMCKELMLIIEVDGITHQWEEIAENDKIREDALTAMGFTVMRFNDDDVLTAINGVYYQIEDFIKGLNTKSTPCPRQPTVYPHLFQAPIPDKYHRIYSIL